MPLSRRSILQSSLLTMPFLSATRFCPQAIAELIGAQPSRNLDESGSATTHAGTPEFVVRAGESRAGAPWRIEGVPVFWVKIAGEDVGGRLTMIEVTTPAGVGPPMHVHANQNEFMYLTEGSMGIEVGGKRSVLKAGDCYMVPKGVPHTYVVLGTQTARHLNVYDPAGKIEAFFQSYEKGHVPQDPSGGTRSVGPPLKTSDFSI